MAQGYTEAELVKNRSSLLLTGGGDSDRRAWAQEAASYFPGEGLVEVTTAEELAAALEQTRGVVYLPNAGAIGYTAQGRIVFCLQNQEERPKLIIGLPTSAADALAKGDLRDDLHYRLQMARVDLSTPGLKDTLKARRAARAKEEAKRPPPPPTSSRIVISRPSTKLAPAKKLASKPGKSR